MNLSNPEKFCTVCNAASDSLKICSACKNATYCSIECQRKDWKDGHKIQCKKL